MKGIGACVWYENRRPSLPPPFGRLNRRAARANKSQAIARLNSPSLAHCSKSNPSPFKDNMRSLAWRAFGWRSILSSTRVNASRFCRFGRSTLAVNTGQVNQGSNVAWPQLEIFLRCFLGFGQLGPIEQTGITQREPGLGSAPGSACRCSSNGIASQSMSAAGTFSVKRELPDNGVRGGCRSGTSAPSRSSSVWGELATLPNTLAMDSRRLMRSPRRMIRHPDPRG